MQIMKNKAFTMAETLVALLIIGVVASITLPGVVQNIQDRRFKAMYKHDVAVISEAMKLLYANEDMAFRQSFSEVPKYACALKKYLKVKGMVFDCPRIESYTDDPNNNFDNWIVANGLVWHKSNKWHTKDGLPIMQPTTYYYSTMHLTNGAMIFFPCVSRLYIDVNGYKKPNVVGRDIFALPISDNATAPAAKLTRFVPQSCFGDNSTSTVLTQDNYVEDCHHGHGWGCSILYLEE